MRKTPFLIIFYFAGILYSFSQTPASNDSSAIVTRNLNNSEAVSDSSGFKIKKLSYDEINFVSGYYSQDGNHSGVTGGIGTEKLTDFANTIELKLSGINKHGNKNILSAEVGIDTYTSASSDNIAPLSSASRQDTRIYPSLTYSTKNTKNHLTLGGGVSYSHEFEYESRGVNAFLIKSAKNENRELGISLFAYSDGWKVIYPYELRSQSQQGNQEESDYSISPRNSFQATFSLSQVINKRMQMALIIDPAYQQGQLSTLYQRVYFTDNSERVEKLPDTRFKIPAGIRMNYFMNDKLLIRTFYRFYTDSWGDNAHTADIETVIKLTPFFSVSPFYRFSQQSGIKYFAAKNDHLLNDEYYTSDYDLSAFTSNFFGAGFRLFPPSGVFGLNKWNSIEIRYGHYLRSTDLVANSISMALKFK